MIAIRDRRVDAANDPRRQPAEACTAYGRRRSRLVRTPTRGSGRLSTQGAYAEYWSPMGRVDNVHGDRNLFCSCVPMSAYE